jgi:thiol peroxidase
MATAVAAGGTVERAGAVTFKGAPLTLVGPELKVGAMAADVEMVGQDLAPVRLSQSRGKVRLISVVPSLDTPVCDAQTKRMNDEAAKLPHIEILAISMDLPFAQKRWCGATGTNRIKVVSDYKNASFGTGFGVLVKELRLLARAVFVLDGQGVVQYAEVVPEVTSHPNYDAALAAVRRVAT